MPVGNTDIMHLLESMRKLLAKFTSASMKNMTWMPSYPGDLPLFWDIYRQVSNIRRTLVGDKIVDNSDVVGASPVGAAPTTSSLST